MSFETRLIFSFGKHEMSFETRLISLGKHKMSFESQLIYLGKRKMSFETRLISFGKNQQSFRDTTYFFRETQDVFRDTATLVDIVKCCHADSMKTVPSYQYMIFNCDVINSNECVKAWKN